MRQYRRHLLITSLIASTFLSGCSYKDVEVYQKNDHLLNCQKLSTQIANIIDENDNINENTGLENKSVITWVFWPPLGVYNESKAAIARNKIDERFEHLIRLKYKNNCKISMKEKIYMTNKGRLYNN